MFCPVAICPCCPSWAFSNVIRSAKHVAITGLLVPAPSAESLTVYTVKKNASASY